MTNFSRDGNRVPVVGGVLSTDGVTPTPIEVDGSGNLKVSASIDPTGLATEAKQDDIIMAIGAIPGGGGTQYTEGDTDASITGTAALVEGAGDTLAVLTQPLTDAQLRASDVKVTLDGESVPVTGTFWQATQPVSAASLPLPTGAATEAKQDTGNTSLGTIAGAVSGTEMQVDVLTMPTTTVEATNLDVRPLVNTDVVTAELSAVDNAVLDNIDTDTSAIQTAVEAIQAGQLPDGHNVTVDNASIPVTGTFWQATQPVSTASLPLPTGASTEATLSALLTELYVMNGGMAVEVDDTGTTLYHGWAEPGTATSAAGWRIRKVVSSGTPTDTAITWADGDRSFDNIWDNRASLSYS